MGTIIRLQEQIYATIRRSNSSLIPGSFISNYIQQGRLRICAVEGRVGLKDGRGEGKKQSPGRMRTVGGNVRACVLGSIFSHAAADLEEGELTFSLVICWSQTSSKDF